MKLFGGRSPKRHVGYSNSRAIVHLDVGQLKRSKDDRKSDTTVSYRDSRGRKRFKGSKTLTATECMPQVQMDLVFMDIMLQTLMFKTLCDNSGSPRNYPPLFGFYLARNFDAFVNGRVDFPALDDVRVWSGPEFLKWFIDLPWDDLWDDADMMSVVVYLYGTTSLLASQEWKEALRPPENK